MPCYGRADTQSLNHFRPHRTCTNVTELPPSRDPRLGRQRRNTWHAVLTHLLRRERDGVKGLDFEGAAGGESGLLEANRGLALLAEPATRIRCDEGHSAASVSGGSWCMHALSRSSTMGPEELRHSTSERSLFLSSEAPYSASSPQTIAKLTGSLKQGTNNMSARKAADSHPPS